ncbi:hypothetical protein SRHO_G00235120 [Serrasalmus rhombeus]
MKALQLYSLSGLSVMPELSGQCWDKLRQLKSRVKTLAHLYSCGNDPATAACPDKSMGNAENGEMSAGDVLP